jgi:hypothetical protein
MLLATSIVAYEATRPAPPQVDEDYEAGVADTQPRFTEEGT